MKYLTLNNGVKMPMLGFGVFQIPDLKKTEEAVSNALEVGYRLIDTAASYKNEEAVGAAIKNSNIKREDIFVTSKLWVQDYKYEDALKGFETSLKNLKLDYIDMYLLHKPYGDYYGAWRALEKLYKEGLIRAIGVTSFWNERLADLFNMNEIKPALNQIETNVWNQKWEEEKFIKENNITHQAWAPFAEGNNDIFNNPVLKEIANKYRKTTGQIMLRWLLQRDIAVIPKSVRKERMKENFDVFGFELKEEDMQKIKELDTRKSTIYDEMDPKIALWIGQMKIHE
ncbi:aldo/keto reductase [Fusobacterium simiae]|uniref:aldo/keto reductase n=1 Tax=Fusobacterium simiae TaxID=855 RepID=UPI0020C3E9DA|nr:aldo/keto reductase [Fusobacterium simiae]MDC7955186.1 aldo/keto reductase [Fusobacterium simiae]